MKYAEVIFQEQQKLVYFYQRFGARYDMFRSTGPYSDNKHYVRNTWKDIINMKFYKEK